MQKLKISLIVLLCGLGLRIQAQTSGYKFRSPLNGVDASWHRIPLPNALFSHTKQGFEDLRIFGIKGKDTTEVPYLIRERSDQIRHVEVPFTLLNESSVGDDYYYTFQSPDNKASVINQINLDFNLRNFDWKVQLEGSNDNKNWFEVLKGYRILSISTRDTEYRFSTLNFPDSKYQYFRVSLKSQVKPDLISAKVASVDTLKGIYQEVRVKEMQIRNDHKTKESILELTLNELAPVSAVRFGIGTTFDYYRRFRIEYATDSFQTDKGMQYNYIGLYNGTLTSLEKPDFHFSNVLASRLRIVIENKDNTPLQVRDAEILGNAFDLIARFDDPSGLYALYYGNEQATAPSYEISKFEDKIPATLTPLNIGTAVSNPAYQLKTGRPLFENKIWLWALMTIIIIILGGFSYKMLKR